MALFNKLFSSHKRKTVTTTVPQPSSKKFPFSSDQVRILLYRECDWQGKKLLFDSTALQKSPPKTSSSMGGEKNFIEISNGYRYIRPRDADLNVIGEMIFGSVAMSFRGTAFKVHWLEEPTRILCSQVFLSPIHSNRFSDHILDTQASDLSSMDTSSFNSFSLSLSVCVSDNLNTLGDQANSNPLDVPASEYSDTIHSIAYSDSGYSGTDPWTLSSSSFYPYSSTRSSVSSVYSEKEVRRKFSTDSSIPDSGVNSGRSDSNLQRRVLRNISTSFENKFSTSDSIGYFDDNVGAQTTAGGSEGCVTRTRRCSEQVECRSNPEMFRKKGISGEPILNINSNYGPRTRATNRRVKLGLALCITLSDTVENEMQLFCSEHITLLESMLCRLRAKAENAYLNKKNFYQVMLNAWFATTEWITDLFTAPRLEKPVWLTLSNGSFSEPAQLAQKFMTELCGLLTSADTKDTNFFVSTLLTAILTHHLGWVGTVAPLSNCKSLTLENAADKALEEKAKMSEISRFRPYNPLWAQLGDLYGSIGNPPKVSKTIVSGSHSQTIDKVLNVLTYFIRCGEIRRETKNASIDKEAIDKIFAEAKENKIDNEPLIAGGETQPKRLGGLTKTATCVKDLNTLSDTNSKDSDDLEFRNILVTFKKNDIPNVLVFRDSRFVQQELRIGNFQMDTGIEMTSKQKSEIQNYQIKGPGEHIRFLITSADEDDDEHDNDNDNRDKDNDIKIDPTTKQEVKKAKSLPPDIGRNKDEGNSEPVSFFWGIESIEKLKKELKIEKWLNLNKDYGSEKSTSGQSEKELKRSKSLYTKSSNAKNVEHIRKHEAKKGRQSSCDNSKDENIAEIVLKSCPSLSDLITANSVGISERLTWGIERVKEAVCLEEEKHFEFAKNMIEKKHKNSNVIFVLGENEELVGLRHVNNSGGCLKKGLSKTATDQVPAFKILKNKYIIPTESYEYLQDKHFKINKLRSIDEKLVKEEIEFGDDDMKSSASSDDLLNDKRRSAPKNEKNRIQLVNIPMPESLSNEDDKNKNEFHLQNPGFIPSLFVGVTDHYIPDVVLQGTLAPISQWETTLKQNLALSSHCATIEQTPTENVAVIASTDNWDVKIVSSQTYVLPCGGGTSGPTGMSQLVASMLETVHAMWGAGTSAYQCMSYIESKLRELYLQSEVLATFLLATEFCSLNNVTSALNLSANDVPLLLSVASIHSPQVTKKYGLSFR